MRKLFTLLLILASYSVKPSLGTSKFLVSLFDDRGGDMKLISTFLTDEVEKVVYKKKYPYYRFKIGDGRTVNIGDTYLTKIEQKTF